MQAGGKKLRFRLSSFEVAGRYAFALFEKEVELRASLLYNPDPPRPALPAFINHLFLSKETREAFSQFRRSDGLDCSREARILFIRQIPILLRFAYLAVRGFSARAFFKSGFL